MSYITALWRNTKQMPTYLRLYCVGVMVVSPILSILLVMPLLDWTLNGRQVSYGELWASGAGTIMLIFILVAAAAAWGFAARAPWSRWAWVATPLVPLLLSAVHPATWFTAEAAGSASNWLAAIATSVLFFVVLFFFPSARAYMRGRAEA